MRTPASTALVPQPLGSQEKILIAIPVDIACTQVLFLGRGAQRPEAPCLRRIRRNRYLVNTCSADMP